MIDWIIRITALLVTMVMAVNLGHGLWLLARLARHTRRLDLWLPAWRSPSDAREWLARWRAVLVSRDPAMVAIRADGRTVLARHARLFASSETWVLLVAIVVRIG